MIPIFPIIAADDEIKARLGSNPVRFYPFSRAPQDTQKPYAVWQTVSGQPFNTLSCPPGTDHYTIQVDAYAETASEALKVATLLRDTLEKNTRCTVTNWAREEYERETKLYRVSFDFDFIHDRS